MKRSFVKSRIAGPACGTLVGALLLFGCQGTESSPTGVGSPEPVSKAAAVGRSVDGATPISGPTEITEPGVYRVVNDFSVPAATGDGIVILADNVRLLLDGHTITGPGNKMGRGIVVTDAEHVFIGNGTLRTFGIGVALLGSNRCAVREIRIEGGDETAAPPANPPQIGVLLVDSFKNRIVENVLELVNLGIFVRGAGSYGNRIARNEVTGGQNGLLAICYNPAAGAGPAGPTHDDVRNNSLKRFGKGIQTSAESAYNRFFGNTIYYFDVAWEDLNGTNEFLHNDVMQVSP